MPRTPNSGVAVYSPGGMERGYAEPLQLEPLNVVEHRRLDHLRTRLDVT